MAGIEMLYLQDKRRNQYSDKRKGSTPCKDVLVKLYVLLNYWCVMLLSLGMNVIQADLGLSVFNVVFRKCFGGLEVFKMIPCRGLIGLF